MDHCSLYLVGGLSEDYKLEICNALTTFTYSLYCTYDSTTPNYCVFRNCNNIVSPTSHAQCKAWLNTCIFTGSACTTS